MQETGRSEQYCSASLVSVSCNNGPVAPIVTPTTSNLVTGQSQTYTISNAVVGAFYGLADATTGRSLGNGVWASSTTVTLTTNTFPSRTYNLVIKGTSLAGVNVCSSPNATASINVNGTLPATVLNFSGKWEKEIIKLQWLTESELNVMHYDVERSTDGFTFNSIGQVKATNLSGRHQYSFTDLSPSITNFYRLRIVDFNGNVKQSRIISLSNNAEVKIQVSPNPFKTNLDIKVELERKQNLRVELLDITGRPFIYKDFQASAGTNQLPWAGLNHLAPGVYILRVRSTQGELLATRKIIKH